MLSGITRGLQGSARAWDSGIGVARNFTEIDYAALVANITNHDEKLTGASATPTANMIAMYDSGKKLKSDGVPTADNDVVRKKELDTHTSATGVHGATSDATASRIVMRDVNSQFKVGAPTDAAHVVRKQDLPTVPALATQSQAEAGTDNATLMTPLRTKQAIEKLSPKPSVIWRINSDGQPEWSNNNGGSWNGIDVESPPEWLARLDLLNDGSDGAFNPTSNIVLQSGIYRYSTINISPGVTVSPSGSFLVLLCVGTATVNGLLTASGKGSHRGTTSAHHGFDATGAGASAGGGGGSANLVGSNGGNGGYGIGAGGNGASPNTGQSGGLGRPTTIAAVMSNGDLMAYDAYKGAGGGNGGNYGSSGPGGLGGNGGGAIFLIAKSINGNGGSILSNGIDGQAGTGAGGGGGGGGGGLVVLAAKIHSNNIITQANGGNGGSGSSVSTTARGGAGGAGGSGVVLKVVR